jgi:aspartyl-tRNA synthetase
VFEASPDGKPVTPAALPAHSLCQGDARKYGSDKPDLRNPMIIATSPSISRQSGFGLFEKIVGSGGRSARSRRPATAEKSRKFFDDMNDWARAKAMPGSAM